ncbi:hypothetical protein J132_01408 [Termitomyces sp. J132]|nr:hypothetical protein J132_01408 [Termitomyces sp. J132]
MAGQPESTGWGVVGYHKGREVFTVRGCMGHKAEVYDAELTGLEKATTLATEYAKRHRQVKHIHVHADNTAAVTSAYELKPAPGQLQMFNITHTVDKFLEENDERTISIEWCPGHEDIKGNERADAEAKAGTELRAQDHTTLTNAKRGVKERALEKWREEWQKTPPAGGFAIANRLPPRWKPREHVTHTPREVFSRLTQCRTKHAFLGEYYARFVPDEHTGCTCGGGLQTREHILQACTNYDEHRHILREADEQMELGILLGTKKGLEATAKFLAKSGAFTKTGKRREQKTTPEEEDNENDEEEERWWRRMEGDREADFGLVEEDDEEGRREETRE